MQRGTPLNDLKTSPPEHVANHLLKSPNKFASRFSWQALQKQVPLLHSFLRLPLSIGDPALAGCATLTTDLNSCSAVGHGIAAKPGAPLSLPPDGKPTRPLATSSRSAIRATQRMRKSPAPRRAAPQPQLLCDLRSPFLGKQRPPSAEKTLSRRKILGRQFHRPRKAGDARAGLPQERPLRREPPER